MAFKTNLKDLSFVSKPTLSQDFNNELYHSSRWQDRILIKTDSQITTFGFMPIQSLTKSSSGNVHNTAIVVATSNGKISIFDIYANLLAEIQLDSSLISYSASVLMDDMFFIGSLANGSFCEFNFTMTKKFHINPMNSRLEIPEAGNVTSETGYTKRRKQGFDVPGFTRVNESKMMVTGTEDLYSKRYKSLLGLFRF